MSYFIFPQGWIAPAIAAASLAFGSLSDTTQIIYRNLPGQQLGQARPPRTIAIDKKPAGDWPKAKAQCVIAHEFGHLRGRGHSKNPRSIMYPVLSAPPCHRWLKRHGLE
jgi:hypothetical protein